MPKALGLSQVATNWKSLEALTSPNATKAFATENLL